MPSAPIRRIEQDRQRVRPSIEDGKVGETVAIEIAYDQGGRIAAGFVAEGGLKTAIAIAQQHTHAAIPVIVCARTIVGHGQVEDAVAVPISHDHGGGRSANMIAGTTAERGVIVAQHDAYGAARLAVIEPAVSYGQVE